LPRFGGAFSCDLKQGQNAGIFLGLLGVSAILAIYSNETSSLFGALLVTRQWRDITPGPIKISKVSGIPRTLDTFRAAPLSEISRMVHETDRISGRMIFPVA
jgi:hypothetical protein